MKTKLNTAISFICILFIFSCQKEITGSGGNTAGTTTGSAIFLFAGAPGACSGPVIYGIFQKGTGMDTSNRISAQVNVTSIGTYSISSNTANGITFSVNDSFSVTGLQTIFFKATGTPAASGSFNFTLGKGGCIFSVLFSGGTTSNNSTCKDCSYVPLCIGTKYSFYDTTNGIASIKSTEFLNSVDTIIDTKIFKKISVSNGAGYYNCTSGETTVIAYQLTSNNGNTLQKLKFIMIKANASLGTTWSDSVTNSLGQTVIQKFKIEDKGLSKTVGSFNFTDIIVVSLESGVDMPPFGYYAAALTNYYYAKGVGLVEVTVKDLTSGLDSHHSVIKSYFVP